jgi:putative endonuclease
MSEKRLFLGRRGEVLACEFLEKSGYKILQLNYRGHLGEIDLVAEDGECLVFVEVKTRSGLAYGHPFESINLRKQRQLIRAASEYLAEHGAEERICRFDAVSVLDADEAVPLFELVKNAFELNKGNWR